MSNPATVTPLSSEKNCRTEHEVAPGGGSPCRAKNGKSANDVVGSVNVTRRQ
jgi:hypothetical protein